MEWLRVWMAEIGVPAAIRPMTGIERERPVSSGGGGAAGAFARVANQDPLRKQLVGLLPLDRQTVLPEGSQVVESAELPAPPVPMLGHVTSSYRSAELDRSFAVNTRATLLLAQAYAARHRGPGGRIVWFTSGQYHGGMPGELVGGWRTVPGAVGATMDMEYGFSCMGYEVAGPWGAVLVWQTVLGLANGQPRRQAEKRARKRAAKLERKAARDEETGEIAP